MPAVTAHASRGAAARASFFVVAVAVGTLVVGGQVSALAAPTSTTAGAAAAGSSKPLSAPKTSFAQDTKYLTDVTEADQALVGYEQKRGNVAVRALLTDGAAFCALLKRAPSLDEALVEEAQGVRGTEAQTHLPLSVTTFNTLESVALLTLCPSEQKQLPGSVRARIRALGGRLAKHAG